MPMKFLRMLSLNETSHSMLFWDTQKFRLTYKTFCSRKTTSTCIYSQKKSWHSISNKLQEFVFVSTCCMCLN